MQNSIPMAELKLLDILDELTLKQDKEAWLTQFPYHQKVIKRSKRNLVYCE